MDLIVESSGNVRCVYAEAIDLHSLGKPKSAQARRVCQNQLESLQQLIIQEAPGQTIEISSWLEWFQVVDGDGDLGGAVELAKLHSKE